MAQFEAQNPDFARDLEGLVRNVPIVEFLRLRLVAPAIGSFLAHGVVVSAGRTLSVAEARVSAVAAGRVPKLCATGLATLRNFAAVRE